MSNLDINLLIEKIINKVNQIIEIMNNKLVSRNELINFNTRLDLELNELTKKIELLENRISDLETRVSNLENS